ncbi:MAG: sensor histidine kinase, two-component system, NtrC family, sensor histidine kinase HydH [Deltaproteobacteria bacterium CSP1-8]|nr:MAG: sensor histidine kinase, two-component system, NtrC family, sensor histidine kinase HydH [Deltaproteobacteria bacterium CSP1-8]
MVTKLRPSLPGALRAALFTFLLLSSAAVLYATRLNARTAQTLAEISLESTALALSTSAETALRAGGIRAEGEIRDILSDRVVAYALIAGEDGTVLFHSNPGLAGTKLQETGLEEWLRSGKTYGRRVSLGTGLPAYEFNYLLRSPDGKAEILRLVLHTTQADRILSDARKMWWTVGAVLLLLWAVGIALERVLTRHLRLHAEVERRERLALIGQMTATLAHEIRNALGSVKGYTQWVDEKVEEEDPRKKALGIVLRGTERIESLVNDLLLFSREESYSAEPVDPIPLLKETVAAEASGWAGKVEVKTVPGMRALADPDKLRRVLVNGVRNAIQAMGGGGVLKITARPERHRLVIRIEDTGPGIPAAELPRLFSPFHTTKTDGTGLGLAYSKKVIDGMKGGIELSNREEGGAVLAIHLPIPGEG